MSTTGFLLTVTVSNLGLNSCLVLRLKEKWHSGDFTDIFMALIFQRYFLLCFRIQCFYSSFTI